jgi:hypothetical protein
VAERRLLPNGLQHRDLHDLDPPLKEVICVGQSKEGSGSGRHVTSASMAENRPPLVLPGDSTQTEVTIASLQCAEATGKRAWLLGNGRGCIERVDGWEVESCYKAPDLLCLNN